VTRDEQLMEKFEEWMRDSPGGGRMLDEGFLHTHSGRYWLKIFVAGANAAMGLQFEPGAVRFGNLTDEEVAILRDAPDGELMGLDFSTPPLPTRNFTQQYNRPIKAEEVMPKIVPLLPELGGEG